jgi:hypothetical protein
MPKFYKFLSYFLLALSLVMGVIFYAAPDKEAMTNVLLYYAYILFGATILAAIALPLKNFIENPKGLKKVIFSIVAVIVVFGVSYLLSSGAPLDVNVTPAPSESTLKITDTALYVTYILALCSLVAILYGGISKMIKNR